MCGKFDDGEISSTKQLFHPVGTNVGTGLGRCGDTGDEIGQLSGCAASTSSTNGEPFSARVLKPGEVGCRCNWSVKEAGKI